MFSVLCSLPYPCSVCYVLCLTHVLCVMLSALHMFSVLCDLPYTCSLCYVICLTHVLCVMFSALPMFCVLRSERVQQNMWGVLRVRNQQILLLERPVYSMTCLSYRRPTIEWNLTTFNIEFCQMTENVELGRTFIMWPNICTEQTVLQASVILYCAQENGILTN